LPRQCIGTGVIGTIDPSEAPHSRILHRIMLLFIRRYLALAGLLFWLGGFTFYAAVVVPIGQEVLGSHFEQGMITRQVTQYLNWSAALALLPLAWDGAAAHDPSSRRRLARWLSWAGMLLSLGVLVWLHPRLDALLDVDQRRILERQAFRASHRWYLWLSTIQWACGLIYLGLSLLTWRAEDRAGAKASFREPTCQARLRKPTKN